jgi:hypothetical protein
MKRSEQIQELAAALAKAQGQIKGAEKDRENPHFKSVYATLDSVWEACRAPLSSNGLALVQAPSVSIEGGVVITTLLMHQSGQWIETDLELAPRDGSPQAVGSAITYGRRYALMAVAGIAPTDDDDGNAASHPGLTSKPGALPQVKVGVKSNANQDALPVAPADYVCQFGQKFKGIAIRDIPAADLRDYVDYLKRSAAEQKKKPGGSVAEFVKNADAYLGGSDPQNFQNANSHAQSEVSA